MGTVHFKAATCSAAYIVYEGGKTGFQLGLPVGHPSLHPAPEPIGDEVVTRRELRTTIGETSVSTYLASSGGIVAI